MLGVVQAAHIPGKWLKLKRGVIVRLRALLETPSKMVGRAERPLTFISSGDEARKNLKKGLLINESIAKV